MQDIFLFSDFGLVPIKTDFLRKTLIYIVGGSIVRRLSPLLALIPAMGDVLQDLSYGSRMLLNRPVFTLAAVLSLVLGIGACTSMFSLIRSTVLAPLHIQNPDRLVSVYTTDVKNVGNLPSSYPNFEDFRKNNEVFSEMLAATYAFLSWHNGDSASEIIANVVSGNYFDVLGVKAARGRTFSPEEDKTPGSHPVVVLSHGFWQRALGGDETIVGKTLTINRHPFTVIGIAAEGFTGTELGGGPDLWVPMMMRDVVQPGFTFYNLRRGLFLVPIGRLKDGITFEQAAASMTVLAQQLASEYPKDNEGRGIRLVPLQQARLDPDGTGKAARMSGVMSMMVLIILLIVCVNVANLIIARTLARSKEIAMRTALGATRGRLIRQLLVESFLLVLIAGVLSLGLTYGLNKYLGLLNLFAAGPNQSPPSIDGSTFLLAFGITALCGLIFGLAPALQSSKLDVVTSLKGEPAANSRRGSRSRIRKGLVVVQIGLSVVSLIAAGLMVRSIRKMVEIDPGFHTDNVLVLGMNLAREGYTPAQGKVFHNQLMERIRSVPGVQATAIARDRPFTIGLQRSVYSEGEDTQAGGGTLVKVNQVGFNFFETLGISLLQGRSFDARDGENAPKTAVINETAAARFWPGQEAVGRRFKFFGEQDFREVVGVVKDSKYNSLLEERRPFIYLPLQQNYAGTITLYARTAGDPFSIANDIRTQVRTLEPGLPILKMESLRQTVDVSFSPEQKTTVLMSVFSAVTLLLAAVGLYGVMANVVAQRTREMGIRMALGARKRDVVLLVLRQALLLTLFGIALGAAAAFVAARLLGGTLFGLTTTDPSTFGLACLLMAAVALVASYFPARRATGVNPLTALRSE